VGISIIHYDHHETIGPVERVLEGRLSALYTRRKDKPFQGNQRVYLQQKMIFLYPLHGFEEVCVERQRVSEFLLLVTQQHFDAFVFRQLINYLYTPANNKRHENY